MSTEKISAFPNASAPSDGDLVTGLQPGTGSPINKNFSYSQISGYIGAKNLSNLTDLPLSRENLQILHPGNVFIFGVDHTLSNPLGNGSVGITLKATSPGINYTLPTMINSDPATSDAGTLFFIEATPDSDVFNLKYPDGTTLISNFQPGQFIILFLPAKNATLNGFLTLIYNSANYLLASNNLSDLQNRQTALANLGQGGDPLIASASSSNIILTNPCPTFIIASFTAPGHILKLPAMNTSTSLSTRGIASILVFNDGVNTYNIQYQDGTNITPISTQQALLLRLVDNSTANGTIIPQPWDFTVNGITGQVNIAAGTGISVSNSGQTITISGSNGGATMSDFIVGATNSNYTTIQSAITAASSIATSSTPVTVYIKPGIYTENVTLAPWVNLIGTTSMSNAYDRVLSGVTSQVLIAGHVSLNFPGNESISVYGITFQTPDMSPGLFIQGTGFGNYIFQNCIFDGLNSDPLLINAATRFIEFIDCTFWANTFFAMWVIFQAGVKFINCGGTNYAASAPCAVSTSGTVNIEGGTWSTFFTIGPNARLTVLNASVGDGGSTETFTIDPTGGVLIFNSDVFCQASSSFFATGTGTIQYGNVTPTASANKIDPALTLQGKINQVSNISFNGNTLLNTDGQLWIGKNSNVPQVGTIVGDGAITIGYSSPNITVSSMPWTDITASTFTLVPSNSYTADNATGVTFTLPVTCAYGKLIRIEGMFGQGGWSVFLNGGQSITYQGSSTTDFPLGNVSSSLPTDGILLLCTVANMQFKIIESQGDININ